MSEELGWLRSAGTRVLLAEIHATVELERALEEHGADPRLAADAAGDDLLGARVVVIAGGMVDVAIAEPSTEGRLAATLARHGEGTVGRYVAVPVGLEEIGGLATAAGVPLSPSGRGPFGPETLILGGRASGPHLILVDGRTVPSLG